MLHERLRYSREKKNLTRRDVADHLGVSVSAYGLYEQGRREPDYTSLQKLADLYEVTVDYLLGRSLNHLYVDFDMIMSKGKDWGRDEEIITSLLSCAKDLSRGDLETLLSFAEFLLSKSLSRKGE